MNNKNKQLPRKTIESNWVRDSSFQIHMNEEELLKFKTLAKEKGKNLSQLVRELLCCFEMNPHLINFRQLNSTTILDSRPPEVRLFGEKNEIPNC